MTPFEETPLGVHIRFELALKEFELHAFQEKMNNGMLNNDTLIPADFSILDKPQITYTAIDLDDIFADLLQDLHSEPLENKLQCLIDDNSLDIEFANLITNMQGQERYDTSRDELEEEDTFDAFPIVKEEFYEVFPLEGSQGNALEYLYKSLALLLQQFEETCTPCTVHPLAHEDLFTYMMPMHRKRVRLRKDYALRCSKPQLEVRLVNH